MSHFTNLTFIDYLDMFGSMFLRGRYEDGSALYYIYFCAVLKSNHCPPIDTCI